MIGGPSGNHAFLYNGSICASNNHAAIGSNLPKKIGEMDSSSSIVGSSRSNGLYEFGLLSRVASGLAINRSAFVPAIT